MNKESSKLCTTPSCYSRAANYCARCDNGLCNRCHKVDVAGETICKGCAPPSQTHDECDGCGHTTPMVGRWRFRLDDAHICLCCAAVLLRGCLDSLVMTDESAIEEIRMSTNKNEVII